MQTKKLCLGDLTDETRFILIAIHTSIEDFRLAFLLNQKLNIHLVRRSIDLEFKSEVCFPIFEWEDEMLYSTWNLISNICKKQSQMEVRESGLFDISKNVSSYHYIIPEFSKANFILKISDDSINTTKTNKIINKIQDIPHVVMAYNIAVEPLKTKTNLIFN